MSGGERCTRTLLLKPDESPPVVRGFSLRLSGSSLRRSARSHLPQVTEFFYAVGIKTRPSGGLTLCSPLRAGAGLPVGSDPRRALGRCGLLRHGREHPAVRLLPGAGVETRCSRRPSPRPRRSCLSGERMAAPCPCLVQGGGCPAGGLPEPAWASLRGTPLGTGTPRLRLPFGAGAEKQKEDKGLFSVRPLRRF